MNIFVLGAVDKYRIRKKHPLPKTIWDGEETGNFMQKKDHCVSNEMYAYITYFLLQYIASKKRVEML